MQLQDLQTPALLIRLDRVRANIARMLELLDGDAGRWRPHVKTSKVPEVMDLLLDAGVRHFKCATTREAAVLLSRARQPIDLLVAMGLHGANRQRLAVLAREHPAHRVSMLTEDPEHASQTRAVAPEFGLFVDLNPGYHRTGIALAEHQRIVETLAACGGRLRGLHFYDGHLHDGTPAARSTASASIYRSFVETADAVGAGRLELITSGTPTFPMALGNSDFAGRDHKVSPGTVVYWDDRSEGLSIAGFAPAAVVLSRVISVPTKDRVTCDAGSKAVDAAAGDPCARVVDWPNLRALTPSEEHLPLQVGADGPAPTLGALLQLVPRHVCPTVNLADVAVLLEGERIVGVVPVAARGHEV